MIHPTFIEELQALLDRKGTRLDVNTLVRTYEIYKSGPGFGTKTHPTKKFGPLTLYSAPAPFTGELALAAVFEDAQAAQQKELDYMARELGQKALELSPVFAGDLGAATLFALELISTSMASAVGPDDTPSPELAKKLTDVERVLGSMSALDRLEFLDYLPESARALRDRLDKHRQDCDVVMAFFVAARQVTDMVREAVSDLPPYVMPEDLLALDPEVWEKARAFCVAELGKKK